MARTVTSTYGPPMTESKVNPPHLPFQTPLNGRPVSKLSYPYPYRYPLLYRGGVNEGAVSSTLLSTSSFEYPFRTADLHHISNTSHLSLSGFINVHLY